jgi:predicted lipoprotein with Yx(FWY)xxD motif
MELKRRTFLGATALTVGFAGCLGGSGGNGGSNADTTTTTTEASPPPNTSTTGAATTTAAPESPGATGTTGTAGTTGPTGTTETTGPTVQVSSHPDLGDILVGPEGMTLYMFDQDTEGNSASACYDSCAQSWPPLTVTGKPSAGDSVTAQLATFERETGDTQVMAGGWPLYYFAADEQPGDANGQGVNDVWWVLSPDGTPMRAATTTIGETDTPTGGRRY